jgi:hypothetical protein
MRGRDHWLPLPHFYSAVSDGPMELCRPAAADATTGPAPALADFQLRVGPAHDEVFIRLAMKVMARPRDGTGGRRARSMDQRTAAGTSRRRLLVCPGTNRQHPAAAGIQPRWEAQEGAACGIVRHRLAESNTCCSGLLIRGAIAAGQRSRYGTYDSAQARRTSKMRLPDHQRRHPGPQPVYDRYMKGPSEVDGRLIRRERRLAFGHAEPDNSAVRGAVARSTMDHVTHLARPLSRIGASTKAADSQHLRAPQPIGDATLTVRRSAPTQHAIGN